MQQVLTKLRDVLPGDLYGQTSGLIQHLRARSPPALTTPLPSAVPNNPAAGARDVQASLATSLPETIPAQIGKEVSASQSKMHEIPASYGAARKLPPDLPDAQPSHELLVFCLTYHCLQLARLLVSQC